MFGGEDGVIDLPFSHASTTLIGMPATPRGATASRNPGTTSLCPNTAKVKKMSQGFHEVPYFFNATYLLMEIKGLAMYPKG